MTPRTAPTSTRPALCEPRRSHCEPLRCPSRPVNRMRRRASVEACRLLRFHRRVRRLGYRRTTLLWPGSAQAARHGSAHRGGSHRVSEGARGPSTKKLQRALKAEIDEDAFERTWQGSSRVLPRARLLRRKERRSPLCDSAAAVPSNEELDRLMSSCETCLVDDAAFGRFSEEVLSEGFQWIRADELVPTDRAGGVAPASTQPYAAPQSPLFLMGMLARLLAREGAEPDMR